MASGQYEKHPKGVGRPTGRAPDHKTAAVAREEAARRSVQIGDEEDPSGSGPHPSLPSGTHGLDVRLGQQGAAAKEQRRFFDRRPEGKQERV